MKNIITLSLFAMSLSGCGIYSSYNRSTEMVEVDSLYNYIEATQDTTNIASLSWRELFTDSHLQSLIEEALERNSDLKIALLNVDQAQIALSTARMAYLPSISASADATAKSGADMSYSLSASASWEIDIFGKLRNAKESQKAALESSRAYSQSVQTSLISTIANSYYTLVTLDDQLAISRRTLTAWEQNIKTMDALKRAGRLNQTSVLQSKASKVALESSIVTLEEQIAQMENTISTLLMQPTGYIERSTIEDVEFPESFAVGVPMQLLQNRPDVRVAEYNLANAFYTTLEARSSLYPSITIGGSLGFMDSSGKILAPQDYILGAVGSIVQPIFNRGTLRAELNISKLQQEQAELEFAQSLYDAAAEVNSAMIAWQSAKNSLSYYAEQYELLSEAVRSSELLMQHGNTTYLEVLTAQFTLLQCELNYASTKFDEVQSVINLYRALGGGEE